MKVAGFAGYSGSGKTTLVEQLIVAFKARGLRVSVVKHAHHRFDVDQPGKDTFRHREAGAHEVVVASSRRMALMREFDTEQVLNVHDLITALDAEVDWVLVEGFKSSDLPKIEVWRAPSPSYAGVPLQYPADAHIVAIATDDAALAAPHAMAPPVLDLNDAEAVTQWLIDQQQRFTYIPGAPA
jgi:molybdopterin-guanine dinucleotide biosynthesis adapter protein